MSEGAVGLGVRAEAASALGRRLLLVYMLTAVTLVALIGLFGAQALRLTLLNLTPVAVFEHVHGRRNEKREVKVLVGDAAGIYGRFNLDPTTLKPVPIGLEGVTPPLPAAADPRAFLRAAETLTPELSLSAVVVPEREGYKLLLVYAGRVVGELKLGFDYLPRTDTKWLDEFARSRWRFP